MFRITGKNLLPSILFLLALGSMVLWWVVQSSDKKMRSELIQQARIAAQAIPVDLLASISGSEKDLDTVAYQRIKRQLASMRKARPLCKFLYLMGRQADGTVFFFVDSLPPDDEDYAPPGLVYDEVPESYLPVFEFQEEDVVGPVTDRWGTLVTALIPIVSPDTNNLLAVLGMDVDATDWNREIMSRCIVPLLVILLVILLFFLMASRAKILDEIKILQGILPICSQCKKIRDDSGYWNQIEAYIREHSEAEFSHSICEECAKKLYPDLDIEDD